MLDYFLLYFKHLYKDIFGFWLSLSLVAFSDESHYEFKVCFCLPKYSLMINQLSHISFVQYGIFSSFLKFLLLFYSSKGSWNKKQKYKKLGKYLPYCTLHCMITSTLYRWIAEIIYLEIKEKCKQTVNLPAMQFFMGDDVISTKNRQAK